MMKLHTKSRDGKLYEAYAIYENELVTVLKGSKINRKSNATAETKRSAEMLRMNNDLFDDNDILQENVTFKSLSTAATFVTGRVANGMIVWKTDDGKYVKFSLGKGGK